MLTPDLPYDETSQIILNASISSLFSTDPVWDLTKVHARIGFLTFASFTDHIRD